MKIKILAIGKTDEVYLEEGIFKYLNRLKHYIALEYIIILDVKKHKNLSIDKQKQEEGKLILSKVEDKDYLVLLDEAGKSFSSEGFSEYLQKKMNQSTGTLVYVIGGPYGFSEQVYARAQEKIALSKMTFSHQMVRLFFMEQLYRAFSILKGEKYHHQ